MSESWVYRNRYRVMRPGEVARTRTSIDRPLTPLINSPKLSGNRFHLGQMLVGITWTKLPGASCLTAPSVMRTARRTKEDMMPIREVRERMRRGRKVVGRRLRGNEPSCQCEKETGGERANAHAIRDKLKRECSNFGEQARHRVGKKLDSRDAEGQEFDEEEKVDERGSVFAAVGADEDVGVGVRVAVLAHHRCEHLGGVCAGGGRVSLVRERARVVGAGTHSLSRDNRKEAG